MAYTFKEIADSYKVPGRYVEVDESFASLGLAGKESVGLIIGQKNDSAPMEFNRVYKAFNADEVAELAGIGSEIHRIATSWFETNGYNLLKFIAVEQTGGQAATYNLEVAAENAKAGQINLMIAGLLIALDVNEADTAADIAAALIEAINDNSLLPVTAAATEGQATKIVLTAKHKGEAYNNIPMSLNFYDGQKTAGGVTVTIAKGSEGSGNASLMAVLAALGDEYFSDCVTDYFDEPNIRLLRSILEKRFTALIDNPAVVHIGFQGTYAEYITKAAAINCPHIILHPVCEGECMADEFAAASAGLIAYRSQVNPGLSYYGMKLGNILPSKQAFDSTERNLMLNNGVSSVYRDTAGNLYLERPVTTYTKKSTGQKTEAYLDVFTIKLVEYLRYSLVTYMAERFPNYKLADDDFPVEPGQEIATPTIVKAELMAWGKMCQKAGLIERLETVLTSINDANKNRMDALIRPNLINNMLQLAVKMQQIN